MNLTVDEQQIIAIYYSDSREGTITAIQDMHRNLEPEETELLGLTDSALEKLRSMTDSEFAALENTENFLAVV